MFMRFVQLQIKPEEFKVFEDLYELRISAALRRTPGCLFAGLMQSNTQKGECVSMTLWENPEDAKNYEDSGLYKELLDEAAPLIGESSEWRVRLNEDLELEFGPVKEEPVVRTFPVESASTEELPAEAGAGHMYLRIVSAKLLPGRFDDVARVYSEAIIPALGKVSGCRYAYLVRGTQDENVALSVTLWDSKERADTYERSGKFAELLGLVQPMFSELTQWKMALDPSKRARVTTSDDVTVEGYQVVASDSFMKR